MLHPHRPLHLCEPAVMRDAVQLPVKEPVDFRVQDELLGGIPWIAWDLGGQPSIEHLMRRGGYCPLNLDFNRFCCSRHLLFSFALLSLKCFSNRSRRSFQNCSYSCTHPDTNCSGSARKEIMTSRPCLSRLIRPALSSILRCFVTALSAVLYG